jgi:hypothetical protein
MLMTIRYQGGMRVEAVLLAANRERMRLAVTSQRDTIELYKADGCWYTEAGDVIELEALIPFAGTDLAGFCAAVYPRTIAAGAGFLGAWSAAAALADGSRSSGHSWLTARGKQTPEAIDTCIGPLGIPELDEDADGLLVWAFHNEPLRRAKPDALSPVLQEATSQTPPPSFPRNKKLPQSRLGVPICPQQVAEVAVGIEADSGVMVLITTVNEPRLIIQCKQMEQPNN